MGPTLDDILKIPGNRPVFEDLKRLLAEKKAIAFVGAGASAELYPLWGELIRRLCDEAVASGFAHEEARQFWLSMAEAKPAQVVRDIRQEVTPPQLGALLRNIFGPKPEGRRFTAIHAALLRIPFSGYVTTNYDSGLIEARMAERPAVTAAGWSTWRDGDEFDPWRDSARLADPTWCPVLFAHGFYQRSDTIVLDIEEYRRAYEPGPWRRLFEHLWTSAHLVFTGFGFSDPFLDFITGEIVTQTTAQTASPARHIAFVGLGAAEPYSEKRRRFFLQNYDVRPIFYPVAGHDHSALLTLLDALALKPQPLPHVASSSVFSLQQIPSFWMHETSDDDKFIGRAAEQARLDRWVADPAVRAIGITAMGGSGKTALAGHWLKKTSGWRSRPFEGLFAWSFYQEPDSTSFLRTLLAWAHETLGTPKPVERTDLVMTALKLFKSHTLVILLDGLEILQEGPEQSHYGTLLDGTLRKLVRDLCAQENNGLAVLTSRFGFADLERHLGTAFHQLELAGLTPAQGAVLLADLEIYGSSSDREEVSRRLEGHPLGLRVFAETIPEQQRDHPQSSPDLAFRALSPDIPLADKLRRLMIFYQKQLPIAQVRLLGVVALFRTPVAEETILPLVRELFTGEPQLDDDTLPKELKKLRARGILTYEPIDGGDGYAAHPILREHFRATLLLGPGAVTARQAADILRGHPPEKQPCNAKQIERILLAIEILLDAGELKAADDFYRDQLKNGELFQWIPALPEGLRCAQGFVLDEQRQRKCAELLSLSDVRFYLNEVGLFASLSGDYKTAARAYTKGKEIDRELGNSLDLNPALENEAELLGFLGNLEEASALAKEAINHAYNFDAEREVRVATAYLGWAQGLAGQMGVAFEQFSIANSLEKKNHPYNVELYSSRGVWWAEFLIRTGHFNLATLRTQANLSICERNSWNISRALCNWALGVCALMEGRIAEAKVELGRAELIFHNGQVLYYLARVHIAVGSVALKEGDAALALTRAAEAMILAQPREMRLLHADALILRGQARMLEAAGGSLPDSLDRALDDAQEAFLLAHRCGYAWAKRDALALQADVHATLANAHEETGNASAAGSEREAAHRAWTEAEALTANLRVTEEDLAAADAKAEAWLEEWEEKQQRSRFR